MTPLLPIWGGKKYTKGRCEILLSLLLVSFQFDSSVTIFPCFHMFSFKNHKLLSEEFTLSGMNNVTFMWNARELLQISCNFDQLYSKMEEKPSQICEAKFTISGTEGAKATKPQRYCTYCRKVFKQMQTGRMKLSEYREERTKWERSDENCAAHQAEVTSTPTENKWDIPGCKGFSSFWSLSIWYWKQQQKYRTPGSLKKFYHSTKPGRFCEHCGY